MWEEIPRCKYFLPLHLVLVLALACLAADFDKGLYQGLVRTLVQRR
jgi:hypothetical protein